MPGAGSRSKVRPTLAERSLDRASSSYSGEKRL
jgi:hypothetical protein